MKKIIIVLFAGLLCSLNLPAGEHYLGGGIHYWRTVDNVDLQDFDESSYAFVAAWRYNEGLFNFQGEVEIFPDSFAGSDNMVYAPQALIMLGKAIYAGGGIGIYYDEAWADDPYYLLRVGISLDILPGLMLDINGNYQFTDLNSLDTVDDDIGSDTITLGVALLLKL